MDNFELFSCCVDRDCMGAVIVSVDFKCVVTIRGYEHGRNPVVFGVGVALG